MLSFLFGKKKPTNSVKHLPIKLDLHSHILPGIDDGSPDIDTSIALVKGLQAIGVERSIATPHVIGDIYRNTPETIGRSLEQLKQALQDQQIDFPITAAAEYMLDDFFLRLLHEKQPLLTLHKNLILTEQSYASPTGNLHEIAYAILKAGYKPIMAHPERYGFYHNNMQAYDELKEMGFLLQTNLLSLTGYYGKPVEKAARYLLKNDLVDFLGTDLHHQRHLNALQHPANLQLFQQCTNERNFNTFDFA